MNDATDTTYTFRLDIDLKHNVELIAKERDETMAQVLRRAMKAYVAEHIDILAAVTAKPKKKAGK